MALKDKLNSLPVLMETMGSVGVTEDFISEILDLLHVGKTSKNKDVIRRLCAYAVRLYLIKSGSVQSDRLDELLKLLGMEALGHTRAD